MATGSWDRTVRYWDLRNTGSPVAELGCLDRVYSMDTAGSLLVVATAGRHIHTVDLNADPGTVKHTELSNLNHQTKVVTAYPDGSGFALGSIEGRCSLKAVDPKDEKSNFTFRCHREEAGKVVNIWAINDISLHPVHKACFTTAGSDGTFSFWDRVAHYRLRSFPKQGGAITATAFSRDGTVFAYAVGYDWAMGYQKNTPDYPLKLMLHAVSEEEVVRKRS